MTHLIQIHTNLPTRKILFSWDWFG